MSTIIFSCHDFWKGGAATKSEPEVASKHLKPYEVVSTAKTHLCQNVTNVSVESPDLHYSAPRKILIGVLAIIDMENLRFRKAW